MFYIAYCKKAISLNTLMHKYYAQYKNILFIKQTMLTFLLIFVSFIYYYLFAIYTFIVIPILVKDFNVIDLN